MAVSEAMDPIDAVTAVPAAPIRLTVLGSTGSIGTSTLDLVIRNPQRFQVEALVAGSNVDLLAEQARRVGARAAIIADSGRLGALRQRLAGTGIDVAAGPEAVIEAADRPADFVMSAIVGAAGLAPTLRAVRRGARVGLANKETLVCAGALFMEEVAASGAVLLPVDSEHNAIFQVLQQQHRSSVSRLILTASGGPFRAFSREEMRPVTPAQAVAHPNWSMGAKVSVDSASMMNKGLELIEASFLFDMPESDIDILVHPQSIIHSMVEYDDGSVLAQLGTPDMRTPIAYTLAWPHRMPAPSPRLDLATIGRLTFEPPDPDRFPSLRLARDALRRGGAAPTILNAANEVAVDAFLAERIGFLDLVRVAETCLTRLPHDRPASLDEIAEIDRACRILASELVADLAS